MTHDFGVVAELADDVIVMHDGEIVEKEESFELFDSPQEEYTKRLLKASFEGQKIAVRCFRCKTNLMEKNLFFITLSFR